MEDTGVLLIAESYNNGDMYHAIRFPFSDPVIYLRHAGREMLVCPTFEREQAAICGRVADVRSFDALGYTDLLRQFPKAYLAFTEMVHRLLLQQGVHRVIVTGDAPVQIVDHLRRAGIDVRCDPEILLNERIVKDAPALAAMETAQRANERAMGAAIAAIADSEAHDGVLVLDGAPLTAERLRAAIDTSLLLDNCAGEGTIVACGRDSAAPHNTGSGPLRPNQPIVLDLFPRHKELRYYADMTRTVSKGDPGAVVRRMYDATLHAQELALRMIAPGVNGRDVYETVCRYYEDAGYATSLRSGSMPPTGLIHTLGHGLGLQVHEQPGLGIGEDILREGYVVTVEPGLYDPAIGGVRIEDVVVVTATGCRNLTQFEKTLVV